LALDACRSPTSCSISPSRADSSRTRSPGSLEGRTTTAAYVGAGAAVLLVTALLARRSGFGPFAAGLVWGVLPAAVAAAGPLWMPRRLDDLPHLYDNIGLGLTGVQLFVLPSGGRSADRVWA
jgi:hypothetical protein